MNDSITPSVAGGFPTFTRFYRWLFSRRTIRRCLFMLACFATLLGLFYAEENWRGRRVWNKYRQELEARGVQLDYQTFIPKPVSDEQNFAATPFVQSWFIREIPHQERWFRKDNYSQAGSMVKTAKDNAARKFIDLAAWAMALDT